MIWAWSGVVILATAMALLGAWRSWRVRGLRVTAILLMVLPGMLVLMTGFGGEVLFRAFLFAAPFIAFLAAAACLPRDGRGFPWRNLVATALLTAVLLPGFLLSYYGKERQNYFTPAEVAGGGVGRQQGTARLPAGGGQPELPDPVQQLRALHLCPDRPGTRESCATCSPTRWTSWRTG